jgi:hypothetical protein
MTIQAQLADGRVLEFPDGTDPQVIQSTVKRLVAESAPTGNAGFSFGDILTSFGQGAVGSTKALTDVAGADNALSQKLESAATSLQGNLSAARQAELQRQEERTRKAAESGSTWEEIKAAAQNVAEAPLQSAAQALGSFVPYLPTMFLGPVAAGLGLTARGTAAATAVARAAAAAPTAIGTAQGLGAAKSAIYDSVYAAELKDGLSEEEARAKASSAQDYFGQNIDQILLGGGAGFVAGRYGAESLLRPGVVNAAGRSALGRVGLAAATDFPTEAFQGGQEQLAANLALQRTGRDTPTFEGVAGQAMQEGLMGVLGSAPVAIASGRSPSRAELDKIQQEEAARLAVSEEELAQRFPDTLPGGFKIEQEELGREMGPQGYNIMAEGREQPLSSVDTEEEAKAKLESLTKIRAEEREKLLKEEEKINSDVQKAQRNLERLEATEQTDTDEYRNLKAQLPTMMDESAQKIKGTYDKIESLSKPLSATPFGEVERVNSQFKLLGPNNKQVGVFKTREQAEGAVEQSIGEDTFKQAKEKQAAAKELYKTFVPQMRKFGLGDVGLNIVDRIENNAGGAYLNKLIRVSLEDSNPIQTMRHESLHALKDLGFFTPQQWSALERQAKKTWIQELKNTPYEEGKSRHDAYIELFTKEAQDKGLDGKELDQYVNDSLIEEVIADAFGAYDKGAKPPPGMIAALVRKLKAFFASLSQALRGAGFQSADDIFQAVERGELKPAAKAKPEAKPEESKPEETAPKAEEKRGLRKAPKVEALDSAAEKFSLSSQQKEMISEGNRRQFIIDKFSPEIKQKMEKALQASKELDEMEARARQEIIGSKSMQPYRVKAGKAMRAFENALKENNVEASSNELLTFASREGRYGDFNKLTNKEKFSLAGVPLSTRSIMEMDDTQARAGLGLKTTANRGRFNNVREIAKALNQATLDTFEAMDRKNLTDEDAKKIATAIADEVEYQVGTTAKTGTGLGWYSHNYPNAVKRLAKRFPELKTNEHARSVFTALVAVTSNGERVNKNISNAVELYSSLRDGKPLVAMGNRRGSALDNNLKAIEELIAQHGENFKQVLLKEMTVKDMNAALRALGQDADGSYLADTVVPAAAVYFGPKLGAFYANLSGSEGYLTMDLWWTRSINRMRGLLMPKATDASINKFREMMDKPDASREEVVAATITPRNKYEEYGFTSELEHLAKGKEPSKKAEKPDWFKRAKDAAGEDAYDALLYEHNLEKMANTIYKNEYEMLEEAPFTASDRAFMYDAARKAQADLRDRGINLTLADIQAALWYYEKRLYGKLSGKTADDIGYEEAIIAQADQGDGPAGPSVVFSAKPDGGDVANGEGKEADGVRGQRPGGEEKLSLRRTDTKAFKDWFGDSKVVDKDGKPLVMYHGLAKDTTDFTRKTARGAPIFLTDDPEFAEIFSTDSYEAVARHPENYLSKEQIADGVKRAIAAIKKDYGKDSLGKEMVESLREGSATPEAREYLQKEFIGLLPTGPHIMPLYVRAENPFDYENPEHVKRVLDKLKDVDSKSFSKRDAEGVEEGDWASIERPIVQEAIKALGFDSFYVEETGRKNLAVYEPNQVKSATGNIGTYSRDSNDVRYSLRNVAFPTVKEAKEAAEAVDVPDTMEFKRYIAGNQWVDEDGKAKKFYHATTSNFFEFNEGVIYLSDTAEESEKWGRMAEDRLREQVYKALNKDEKLPFFQKAVDEAVSSGKITEAQGDRFMRDAGRKIPEFDGYDLIKKEMDEALLSLAPDRMKIMPLYARAVTPFDFRNKEHVQQVMAAYDYTQEMDRKIGDVAKQVNKEIGGAPTVNVENILDGLKGILAQGYPKVVERPDIIRTIRKLGFDGYITRRNRNAPMSYAVFKPEQVKSITGNDGEFGVETKDVRYSLRSFKPNDLPSNNKPYTLPQDTLIFHGAHKNAAKKIEESGRVLLSYPGVKSSSGSMDEGGLIFFGGKETATAFATQKADPLSIKAASERGEERLPGTVFETATDRPYLLMSRHHKLSKDEASVLNEALGIPDYKRLNAGDSADIAAYRAYTNSNKIKREKIANEVPMASPWPIIFDSLGFDGFYDNVNAPAIALTANNGIRLVGKDGKLEKFSLPSVAPQINARVDMLTTAREQKGFAQRMIEAISPKTFSSLRQSYLNRYEQLGRYDKLRAEQMGGAALMADQSAESAALMSDLASGVAASAMGYGDRNGGVPVYRNGATVIDRSVKGLIASLAPLAKYGDPKVYQYYQFWAGAKRAQRLMAEGRERLYTQNDFAYARTLERDFPEFVDVQRDLIAFNNGIVKYMVQTQVLSPEMGRKYTEHADYIPFYRQMEGERTSGPNIFSAISGVRPPKKLKGGDTAVADLLENLVRNTQSSIEAGMKNAAANRAIKVVSDVVAGGNVPGVDLVRLNTQETGPNIINVLENGTRVSYKTTDKLLVEAVGSLNMSELPFMGLISAPSNLLRNLVTKDPGFMMANLIRDSLSAYVTSGQSMTPIAGTMTSFAKALARKSPGYEALLDAGIIGGYELSQNVEQSGESLAKDLDKKAGKKDPILMRPFTSLWNALETGTTASDAATRALVYERVLAETGNEAEALYRSLEVMNFNRKGNSPLIRVLTAAVPFFNARLQGLDLFYRASTGNMNTNDAKAIQRKFFVRGASMMALSVMYYMMVADDDEYKAQEQETKDNNWILPSLGIRIPIPFEVGVLFKTMPERITAYALGNDTGKDLRESAVRNLVSTFAFNPIPQTVKPLFEAATNFNFFTMRPIVGQGMSDVAPEFQVGPGTSKVAEILGKQLGMSPMKIDHILKGYTGTMGTYMVDATDLVMEQFGDGAKANKRFEQLPIIKRFALDPEARGTVTAYYELKDAVDTFTRTSNLLEKTSKPEEFVKYVKENAGVFGVKDYVLDLEKEMKELREMRQTITSSSMDGEQKKNLLTTIGRAEQNLTSNIQTVKKVIASLQ